MALLRTTSPPRQGVILLIVVILLTLFLVVGLSFVLYAESEASASRIYRESQTTANDRADVDPQELMDFGVGQLVYGVSDSGEHIYSAMRGHDLARTMYGWNYRHKTPFNPDKPDLDPAFYSVGVGDPTANQIAFSGPGPLRTVNAPLGGYRNDEFVNYQAFTKYQPGTAFPVATDGFIRDPERLTLRKDNGPINQLSDLAIAKSAGAGAFAGGFNVPYTFPDRTNMFLAAVQAAPPQGNGYAPSPMVLRPSFFRPTQYRRDKGSVLMEDFSDTFFWTAPNPAYKYLTLRPRPADMYYNAANPNDPHNFPLPADGGGDVNNLGTLPGFNKSSNDSVWMDLNFPVRTTPTGRKYKPLFAFLITDLDGRVNLNVHGNVASGQTGNEQHASHQGVGKHEVNLSKVLDYRGPGETVPTEWRKLFLGTTVGPTVYKGKYGDPTTPDGKTPATMSDVYPTRQRRSYTDAIDYDAIDHAQAARPLTTRLAFPANFRSYADFLGNPGYDELMAGSGPNPGQRHPLLYSSLSPAGGDVQVAGLAQNLYYLIGTAASGNVERAPLYSLIPNNLISGIPDPNNPVSGGSRRFMTTTLSYDLDVPGMSPLLALTDGDPAAYALDPAAPNQRHPVAPPAKYTSPAAMTGPTVTAGDCVAPTGQKTDGRSALLSRIDMNRKLTPYYNAAGVYVQANEARAEQDRFQFAKDILERLVYATGADRSATVLTDPNKAKQKNALRYLAQLAVNIVDYIDEDDISFVFDWQQALGLTPGASKNDYVYGTEAPRVVINEAYAEMRNAAGEETNASFPISQSFRVNFYLELYNPLPRIDPALSLPEPNHNTVDLKGTGQNSAYRVEIYEQTDPAVGPALGNLRKPWNVDGSYRTGETDPGATTPNAQTGMALPPIDFSGATGGVGLTTIVPYDDNAAGAPGSNVGFYLLSGNDTLHGGTDPQATYKHPQLTITSGIGPAQTPPKKIYTALLRRLANPYKPYSATNPYVTVDYFPEIHAQDAINYLQSPAPPLTPNPAANAPKASLGRRGPYIALNPGQETSGNQPGHTFFKHNSSVPQSNPNNPSGKLDWLIHLDRPLVSPLELLNVSGYKPHELTQQFEGPDGNNAPVPPVKFAHRAPWRVSNARLYRALEFFTVGDRSLPAPAFPLPTGTPPPSIGGRKAGLININTVWDKNVLDALCDANATNYFTQNDVSGQSQNAAWAQIGARRSGQLGGTGTDVPFQSLAAPPADKDNDRQYTGDSQALLAERAGYLGDEANQSRTFPRASNPAPEHPHAWDEMLTKIANNVTTRSNTFAVYLTVGFFEVMDDTTRPVKLGAEIRTREGTFLRHKMFAVVDRTMLALDDQDPFQQPDPVASGKRLAFLTTDDPIVPASAAGAQPVAISGGIPNTYDPSFPNSPTVFQSLGSGTSVVTVYVGYGSQREQARAQIDLSNGKLNLLGFLDPVTATWGPAKFSHPAGTTITTYRPGNPGPQDGFRTNADRYKHVVPFASVIQ